MKSFIRFLLVAVVAAVAWGVYEEIFALTTPPKVLSSAASRGDVVMSVTATGTLQATRTVDVGTQISGIVKKMYVDYNSIVKQGELVAEIDPQTSQQALDSAKASEEKAEIDLRAAEDTMSTDKAAESREEQLFDKALATEQDKEAAELQVKQDEATVRQDEAAISIAKDNIKQAEVTLGFCEIRSPIDGVIVSRNADEGQTVTASLSVPSLYVMAADISELELAGQVDEADIAKLYPGQDVTFTVDAYPGRTFHARMAHVRLSAQTVNNVVTYQAIATVPNHDLRLRPSMTAHMTAEAARSDGVVRIPNVALRFRPTHDVFAALGQTPIDVPPPFAPAPILPPAAPSGPPARSVSDGTRVALASASQAADSTSTTPMIDASFPAMPRPVSNGQVWVMANGHLKNVPLKLGITDGTWSEVLDGDINDGDQLVTGIVLPQAKSTTTASPLLPGRGGPPPGRGR